MALKPHQAVRLARKLRELRDSHWPDVELTQAQLAAALSMESRVAPATISSWESASNPKTPTAARLSAYARFFATRRSLEGGPRLIPEGELTEDEQHRFQALEKELLDLLHADDRERHSTFTFDVGPVTVICPEAPSGARGPLAPPDDPNFTKLHQYADLDALIEIYGHLRASNPTLDIFHRITRGLRADDISTHVILLGGIAWNAVTRRFQEALDQVPIAQVEDPHLETGEIFTVGGERFFPQWDNPAGDDTRGVLIEDVAFLARLPNPFNISRTLTICNGIHSRGVLGAVRCLTDARVRDANERYLAERFPDGRFALLLRVPVVAAEALSPDLQNPEARLYEWPPAESGGA
jgi:transcriptional regulator with XRE-family HTH domain